MRDVYPGEQLLDRVITGGWLGHGGQWRGEKAESERDGGEELAHVSPLSVQAADPSAVCR